MKVLKCLRNSGGFREKGKVLQLLFEKMLGYLHFRTYMWPLPSGTIFKQILLPVASKMSLKK